MGSTYLFLFTVLVVLQVSYNLAAEFCPKENCVSENQCDSPWQGAECADKQKICCSVVKEEHRTACRHHGGECMEWCNKDLQRNVSTCPENSVCCVLV